MKWFPSASVDAYTKSLVAPQPNQFQLIDLPQVDPPSLDLRKSTENYIYAFMESYIPHVRDAVRNIVSLRSSSDSGRVAGLVFDFFCAPMIDIATELGLPSYIYYASNAASLGLMLYLPTRHSQNSSGFEITDPEQLIPGFVNPVPVCVLPSPVFNKYGGYTTFIKVAERFKDAKGIMVNTFEDIEPSALNYFLNGPNPPIYPVGPVIDLNALPHPELDLDQRNKVMTWLDDQPQSSVIFLCFGSMGSFGAPQVKEIALGLEQRIGHLASTIEFAKRLIHHDDRIWVTVLSMKWFPSASVDAYTKSLVAPQPNQFQLIDLPQVDPPSLDLRKSTENYIYAFMESYIPHVRDAVRNIVSLRSSSGSGRVAGLVLDFFCAPMIDIATELGLPSYIYLTSNAAFLGLMLYLPTRHSQNSSEFEITDPEQLIPGFVNPVPVCVLPSPLFNKYGGYTTFIKVAERFKDAKGIMVNTFEDIEPSALNYFLNGPNPPIYPVGPVIDLNALPHPKLDLDQRNKVMTWLDDQPQSSVIFLCFGSMGSFGAPQVKEIALGLEQILALWAESFPQVSAQA
ncbi:hypothetical protein QQP08_026869, partial [Theobroma cacao]